MKKILQICNYFPPHIGGIEQVAKDIIMSLKDTYEIKTICFNGDKGTIVDSFFETEITRVNINKMVGSQQIGIDFEKKLKQILNEFKPDIVIFHYPNPFQAYSLCKYLKNKNFKFILWWHLDITKQKVLGKFFYLQNKKLLKYADEIVATSPNYIENSNWLSKNKDKCVVISCCVDDKRMAFDELILKKASEIKQVYVGKKICFACGRHVEYKGMRYLIEASKYLTDDYKVLIGGKGPLTDDLKKQARNDTKIEFLGKISDEDLKSYLLACDVFCFPSITKNEAFGISLAEAMYYHKPAVTFTINGSGVNYVNLNGVTGIEVDNSNSKAFAEAIMTINNDLSLKEKYACAAEERAKTLFSFETFKRKLNFLIKNISEGE